MTPYLFIGAAFAIGYIVGHIMAKPGDYLRGRKDERDIWTGAAMRDARRPLDDRPADLKALRERGAI